MNLGNVRVKFWCAAETSLSGPVDDRCDWGKVGEWSINKIVNNFKHGYSFQLVSTAR